MGAEFSRAHASYYLFCLIVLICIKTVTPFPYKMEEIDPGQWALHTLESFDDKK